MRDRYLGIILILTISKDTVLTLLKEEMVRQKDAKGFLIDGYPRELEQGTRFESEVR